MIRNSAALKATLASRRIIEGAGSPGSPLSSRNWANSVPREAAVEADPFVRRQLLFSRQRAPTLFPSAAVPSE